ncbi:MAG: HAMP domain-containing protein, partial [Gemmatimonadales bacterium]|nr:HAMP domain-containing protein [Gemmatimonadales bacterium]
MLSYLVILGLGGLITSLVGSWIVSSTLMTQARHTVGHQLSTAQTIYDQQLQCLAHAVRLSASGTTIEHHLHADDAASLLDYLNGIRQEIGFDFVTLTDSEGRVILRSPGSGYVSDDVPSLSLVEAALAGKAVAATEMLSVAELTREVPHLRERARIPLLATPKASPPETSEQSSGLVMLAAAPVNESSGERLGVLYAGILLNRNYNFVDDVWRILYKDEKYRGKEVGLVSIFQGEYRVATVVRTESGERAIGTRVSEDVREAVLERGEAWNKRSFVIDDYYIGAYEPIHNYEGEVVGILSVGQLERVYTSVRNRVILSFFAIATLGFALIIGITYYMIRNITRPIAEMVAATRSIAAGYFDQEVHATSQGEIAQLADSFNIMLKSLRRMRSDLEEWGRTLEEKVKDRTRELADMQARVAQSERLASLGMLAAGVAHELNNPLGGITALTALTLEELPQDDPNRENLEEVVRQGERCGEIVKGLLEFSRQSAAGTERVDVNEVIGDTLELIGKQAAFFNVRVVEELAAQLPAVTADRSQLQQVFMNVFMNAVQAMEGSGVLTVLTTRNEDGIVEIQISNTGRGIPENEIDRIFDPFYSTKGGEGTGLGLSIAYGIVTKHGGTISVASEPGEQTTFTIRLPATLVSAEDVNREAQ